MNRKKPVKRIQNFTFVCTASLLCAVIVARAEYEPVSTECVPIPPPVVEIAPTPTPTPEPTPTETPIVTPEPVPIEPAPATTPEPAPVVDYSIEAEYIAKTIYGEARGCSPDEQKQIVWCILNRVDSENPYFPDDIIGVIVQPWQFHGYNKNNPVKPDHYEIALDVLAQWEIEKAGGESARNLAPEYLFFYGDGEHNYFRITY